jgi:hypothetical protein
VKYDYGLWPMAAIHAAWLLGFAVTFLRPARRREWRSLGIFTGFVAALYVEMFGFPLTIYLLTALLGQLSVGFPGMEPEPDARPARESAAGPEGRRLR